MSEQDSTKPGVQMKAVVPNDDVGTPGKLIWVNIDDLVINHAYQRKITKNGQRLINRIIKEFHWSKMQPLQVCMAKRENKYSVIDGQHRVNALLEMKIGELPCYCAFESDEKEQALAFIPINKDRVQMTALAKHHALVGAYDPTALKTQKCCDDAGVILPETTMSGDVMDFNQTQAVSKIGTLLRIVKHDCMVDTFQIIMSAYPDRYCLRAGLLDAVAKLWKLIELSKYKSDETRAAIILGLKSNEPEGWIMVARNNAENYQISTSKAMLQSLIGAYNRQTPARKRVNL